jgi:hypothetical protein
VHGGGLGGAQTLFGHLSDHLDSTSEGESGMLVGVHPVGSLEVWWFGDCQSLRLNPGEHPIQPIGTSQLDTPRFTYRPRLTAQGLGFVQQSRQTEVA